MPRAAPQLNIRSEFAKQRAVALARETGLTTTQIVEDALRAYRPTSPRGEAAPPGLIRKGRLLVFPAEGRPTVTTEQTLAAIDADREERADEILGPCG